MTGDDGGKTGSASLSVVANPVDHIAIAPASAEITAGGSQSYTAQSFDADGNPLGDVTASTTFSISPDGSCTGNDCTATVAGTHVVTGTNGSKTATASLQVDPGALDHLALAPASATIAAGGSQGYSAQGLDQYGNPLGDVTDSTTFTIAPDGSCSGNVCTATSAGAHTVTGTDGGKTGTASLTVTAGALDHLALAPASASIPAGGSQAYTAQGFDQYGNSVGRPDRLDHLHDRPRRLLHREQLHRDRNRRSHGHRNQLGQERDRLAPGDERDARPPRAQPGELDDHSGRLADFHRPGLRRRRQPARRRHRFDDVRDRAQRLLHRKHLHRHERRRAHRHRHLPRRHGHRDTAGQPGQPRPHRARSLSAKTEPGAAQSYTATGFDAFNNQIGDVTAGTSFTIAPDGSCSGSACTATAGGLHTVTGTNGGKTATAALSVDFIGNTGFETNLTAGTPGASAPGSRSARVAGGHSGGWAAQVHEHEHDEPDLWHQRLAELDPDDDRRHLHRHRLGAGRSRGRAAQAALPRVLERRHAPDDDHLRGHAHHELAARDRDRDGHVTGLDARLQRLSLERRRSAGPSHR